jgi:reactive intermediate/imine deaminase
MRRSLLTVSGLLLLSALSHELEAQSRTYIEPRTPADTDAGPFSGAVLVDNTLYLSGTLGLDENGEVPSNPEAEARNALNTIKRRVEAAGMTMDDLVFVQVFCSDVAHYDAWNRVYRTYFTTEFPARAFLGSGTLLFDARFEIQAIAVRR